MLNLGHNPDQGSDVDRARPEPDCASLSAMFEDGGT